MARGEELTGGRNGRGAVSAAVDGDPSAGSLPEGGVCGGIAAVHAVAERAAVIAAAEPEGTVRLQNRGVVIARAHLNGARRYLNGGGGVGGVAAAELADVIEAPSPNGAVVLKSNNVIAHGADGVNVCEHLNGALAVRVAAARAVADLTVVVEAPDPKGAVGLYGGGQAIARDGVGNVIQYLLARAGVIARGGVIAELTVRVLAVNPKGVVVLDVNHVVEAHARGANVGRKLSGGGVDVTAGRH